MMSASEGGVGSCNRSCSKGICVNFFATNQFQMQTGGGGQKVQKLCGHHIRKLPYYGPGLGFLWMTHSLSAVQGTYK